MQFWMIFLATAFLVGLWFRRLANTPPSGPLYVCVEDELEGGTSALFERQVRRVHWRGGYAGYSSTITFDVEEYRRISCVPGLSYSGAQSDWFKRTKVSDPEETPSPDGFYDHYRRLTPKEAQEALAVQWPAMLKVRKALKRMPEKNRYRGVRAPSAA